MAWSPDGLKPSYGPNRSPDRGIGVGARAAGVALLLAALPGCAVNGLGAARAEVFRGDGAVVIRSETFGAALRTDPADAGLSFGITQTLLVLPDTGNAPAPGHHAFGLWLRDAAPVARIRRVHGLDIGFGTRMAGIMLGFSEDAAFASIPEGMSLVRRLDLQPDRPELTILRQCEEASRCE